MQAKIDALTGWIRTTSAGAKKLLVPVSGGSDSALCFRLCMEAAPEKTVGIHAGERLRCREWFDRISPVEIVDVPGLYPEREEMRWGRFLSTSLMMGAWLVGSRNRTEDALGTYSLASRVATYLPLVGVWKSEVMALCRFVGVPDEIIASSYRADPNCGRPKELAEIPHALIETFLRARAGEAADLSALSPEQIAYLDRILNFNAFKKTLPLRGPRL